jgi:putative ABC transport system permease protein
MHRPVTRPTTSRCCGCVQRRTGWGLKTTGGLYQRYLDRIAQIPGVSAVAVADGPLAGRAGLEFTLEGRSNGPQQLTSYRMVSPGYFSTLQIPILQGRAFTSEDDPSHPFVAIVNEAMARRYWPGENPIGRTIKAGPGPRLAQMTIVGIAGDVRPVLLDAATPQLYVSALQQSEPNAVLFVRTAPDAAASISAISRRYGRSCPISRCSTSGP